jgi:hypothetical protein
MSTSWKFYLLTAVVGLFSTAGAAAADPPSRVARISFVTGTVSFRPSTVDDWTLAPINYPLTIGDHVWTDPNARTELELGRDTIRAAPSTELSVLNLDDRVAQIRLTQGAALVSVRSIDPDEVLEVDTPGGAVSLLQPGLYRLDVPETGNVTTISVRRGAAQVATAGGSFSIDTGQSVAVTADAPGPEAAVVRIDEFEDWALTRERRFETAASAQYVSTDTIGYADLDAYGAWRPVPEYGVVWVPRVQAEWVPYRYGHWAFVEPWGWTWIDDAPWGFAPFHYGRWAVVSGAGWVWIPGARAVRPVYAPALVAFVGGTGWQASLSVGAPVAWFPLGPREVYVPAYRVSPVYVTAINRPHVTVTNVNVQVTNITYVNRAVPNAVTAVPRDAFVRAQPVARVAVAVPAASVRAAAVVGAPQGVQPQARVSVVGEQAVRAPAPPAAAVNRQVIVRAAPPPQPHAAQAAPVRQAVAPTRTPPPPTPAPEQATAPKPAAPTAPPKTPAPLSQAPANADLQARHAQERQAQNAKHVQERADLQAHHQQQMQATKDPAQRKQLQQQHQEDVKALQARQNEERRQTQQRHAEENAAQKKKQ